LSPAINPHLSLFLSSPNRKTAGFAAQKNGATSQANGAEKKVTSL
jgi:hypothetical protein